MSLRLQVLLCYKQLLRTTSKVFSGDSIALENARQRIRDAFLAKHGLTEEEEILEQIKIAEETEAFLRQGVLQGVKQGNSNVYKVEITKDTILHDNVPLKESNNVDLNDFKVPNKYKTNS